MENAKQNRFSGRQVVAMVVAVCVAVVLAPVGVFAAAHAQRVSIVDAKHPARGAAVTASGRQEVTATVSGAVKTTPASMQKPFALTVSPNSNLLNLTLPKGHTVVIQTISANGGTANSVAEMALDGEYKWHGVNQIIGFGLDAGNGLHFFGTVNGPFYADPGSVLVFNAYSPDLAANTLIGNLTITGYTT